MFSSALGLGRLVNPDPMCGFCGLRRGIISASLGVHLPIMHYSPNRNSGPAGESIALESLVFLLLNQIIGVTVLTSGFSIMHFPFIICIFPFLLSEGHP